MSVVIYYRCSICTTLQRGQNDRSLGIDNLPIGWREFFENQGELLAPVKHHICPDCQDKINKLIEENKD